MHPHPENKKEWTFYSLESGNTFVEHYGNAYLMPWSKSIVDRLSTLAVRDPVQGDPDLSINPTDLNYVPQFSQPPLVRRGRPIGNRNRPAVQPPPELNEAINLMAENFLSDLHDSINPDIDDDSANEPWEPHNEVEGRDLMCVDEDCRSA